MNEPDKSVLRLDHPAYLATPRKGWSGFTRRVNVLSVPDAGAACRLLRRNMPGQSPERHREIAHGHLALAAEHQRDYLLMLDEAAQATFGRPFHILDYKISAIGREEFGEAHKAALRLHTRALNDHTRLALVHLLAAGHRIETARRVCREAGL